MEVCRTCLKYPAGRDIPELEKDIDDNTNWTDIFMFCLDIMIRQDSKLTTRLCDMCYKKIIVFYKFKTQSLKTDAYLKTLPPLVSSEAQETLIYDESGIKPEDFIDSDDCDQSLAEDFDNSMLCKVELELKTPSTLNSDEEPLSEERKVKDNKRNIKKNGKENDLKLTTSISKELLKRALDRKRASSKRKPRVRAIPQKPQMCEECGKSVFNLKEHSLQHQPKDKRQMLRCRSKTCSKVFYSTSGRNKHYRHVHLGRKSKCDICNREVLRLSEHKLRVHNPEALPYSCPSCDRRFESRSMLRIHMNLHTRDETFECGLCQKKFRSKGTLSTHRRQVHEKERKHQCEICSKAFFGSEQLKLHLTSHSTERPYICNECGKSFANKMNLYRHLIVHSDVRSHRCDVCDKAFKSTSRLKQHKHSHAKKKPHACQQCPASFYRPDRCRRHVLKHHPQHAND